MKAPLCMMQNGYLNNLNNIFRLFQLIGEGNMFCHDFR